MPNTFSDYELSVENGSPEEFYLFTYRDKTYCYTSALRSKTLNIGSDWHNFTADFISRGDSLKLGDSGGSTETCTIRVSRTNAVAQLYKGAPPENGTVRVEIYRKHEDSAVRLVRGTISQVTFTDSEAELNITIENLLATEIPVGKLSYLCQNCIYDAKCGLDPKNWGLKCIMLGNWTQQEPLTLKSHQLESVESGYYTGGYVVMGSCRRAIKEHKGNMIILKYPITPEDWESEFTVYPSCNGVFQICARRFHNQDNFSGIPYIQPYDAFLHPVSNSLGYWIDGNIVIRDTKGKIHTAGL